MERSRFIAPQQREGGPGCEFQHPPGAPNAKGRQDATTKTNPMTQEKGGISTQSHQIAPNRT
jgi:hypothetical protein